MQVFTLIDLLWLRTDSNVILTVQPHLQHIQQKAFAHLMGKNHLNTQI